ncbi:uncharacterized protein [Diabrotica undecimpunctata]|uniref:uncharacterized protein n=1 Tax=Diabrotica undecimpunctata TaxID=50387 RepID=UPI003B642139
MSPSKRPRTRKRRAIALQNLKIKKVTLNKSSLSNSSFHQGLAETSTLPSCSVDSDSSHSQSIEIASQQKPYFSVEGRRIVDMNFFIKSIQGLNDHSPFSCNFSYMEIIKEKMDGLISTLTFKCKMCNIEKEIATENSGNNSMNLNVAQVMATISTGSGYSDIQQQHAALNIPVMSYRQYAKHTETVADIICQTLCDSIEGAGREELALAKEIGEVDSDGNGLITVIADGAWSKRSYKVNYDASSGVACIVGAKTGKILFVATRNKYCIICARAATKNETVKSHTCSKNWEGSSTSMETDIIVEGFKRSVEMHRLKYIQLVGDGDSSVYNSLCIKKPYGPNILIKKIECINHLLRNYCSRLRDLAAKKISTKMKPVAPELRKRLSSNILRLRLGIKTAIAYRRNETNNIEIQMKNLIKDIKNCPYHVFGQHTNCDQYFCKGSKENEINFVIKLEECGLLNDILSCGNRLIQHTHSLLLNMNNNAAETYNSVISKFVGGKRINFVLRGSYDTRCKAAAISFNEREHYFSDLHKKMTMKSPGKYTNKYIDQIKRVRNKRRLRRELHPVIKKKRKIAPADKNYGALDIEIPTSEKESFLESLQKSNEEIAKIEQSTRGQSTNFLWKEYRHNRLTASNFGIVCKLRKSTNPANTTKKILFSDFHGSAATRWGQDHEAIAKLEFEAKYNLKVRECGLFISAENPFLAASPDGSIDDDHIVEVKCPYSACKLTPEEAVKLKKIKYLTHEENTLKLKHTDNYFYQVQGQLAIAQKKYCYFIVWTPMGFIVDKIEAKPEFWKQILPKLKNFYIENMLPRILSS